MIIKDWSGRSVGRVTRSAELSPPATSSHQALVISHQTTKSSKQKQRTENIWNTNKHLLQALTNSGYILRIYSKQKNKTKKTKKPQKKIYTFDAEIQYIAIGCQMGRNFQILIWTAFANIATQCSFNANKFLTEIFNSQTFVTKWLKHRFEQPVIQDRAPKGQIPGLFDCCHCFHQLLIVSMIASFICWLLSGASQLVSV